MRRPPGGGGPPTGRGAGPTPDRLAVEARAEAGGGGEQLAVDRHQCDADERTPADDVGDARPEHREVVDEALRRVERVDGPDGAVEQTRDLVARQVVLLAGDEVVG